MTAGSRRHPVEGLDPGDTCSAKMMAIRIRCVFYYQELTGAGVYGLSGNTHI